MKNYIVVAHVGTDIGNALTKVTEGINLRIRQGFEPIGGISTCMSVNALGQREFAVVQAMARDEH